MIIAHFTQKIDPETAERVEGRGKGSFQTIQFSEAEVDLLLTTSKKLLIQERSTLKKLTRIEANLREIQTKLNIKFEEDE